MKQIKKEKLFDNFSENKFESGGEMKNETSIEQEKT